MTSEQPQKWSIRAKLLCSRLSLYTGVGLFSYACDAFVCLLMMPLCVCCAQACCR